MPSNQDNRDAGVKAAYGPEPALSEGVLPMEPPKEQPKLTKQQLGQLRRQYITVTHGVVKACSHAAKFSATKPPGNNCIECWRAYFATSVDLEALHKTLTEGGVKKFIATHGIKYVRMFRGFLAQALMPKTEDKTESIPEETI